MVLAVAASSVKRTDLPPEVAAMPLPQRLGWLDSEEATASMTRRARRAHRRDMKGQAGAHAEMLAQQLEAVRAALLTWVCSVYWRDVCEEGLKALSLFSPSLGDNQRHCERSGVYPLVGHLVCRGCNRPTPAPCMSRTRSGRPGHCDDCRAGDLDGRIRRMGRTPYQNDRADLSPAAPDVERTA